ncbi:MAG: hypothetical protein ACOX6T_06885 [Myxococcales bacterium]|jgi:hypothetical protein
MSPLSPLLAALLLAASEAPADSSAAASGAVAEAAPPAAAALPSAEAVPAETPALAATPTPAAAATPPARQAEPERAAILLGDWPAEKKRVSLDFDRTGTRDALSQLARAAGWSIAFEERPHGTVDMQLTDAPADEALVAILRKHDLVARRSGNVVVIEAAGEAAGPAREDEANDRGHGRVAFGHSIRVAEGETVREAVAFGGDVEIDGTVLKDAVCFGGKLVLGPKAVIHGDVVSFGGSLEIAPGATVRGERVSIGSGFGFTGRAEEAEPKTSWLREQASSFASSVVRHALLFVLGLLLLAFIPGRVRVVSRELQRAPGRCAAVGAVGFIALLPLTILLAVTVVGLVALPFLWLAVPIALLLGFTALALFLGARFPSRNPRRSQVLALAIGVAVIFVVDLVPFLGGLALFVLGMIVFGAVLRTRFGTGPQNDANFIPSP